MASNILGIQSRLSMGQKYELVKMAIFSYLAFLARVGCFEKHWRKKGKKKEGKAGK